MDYGKRFFVDPDEKLRLPKLDPSYKGDHESEEAAKQETEHYRAKLTHQQAMLYAQRKHSVLVVLQALDAGGKDGTVTHVFSALNPQGTTVGRTSKIVPTAACWPDFQVGRVGRLARSWVLLSSQRMNNTEPCGAARKQRSTCFWARVFADAAAIGTTMIGWLSPACASATANARCPILLNPCCSLPNPIAVVSIFSPTAVEKPKYRPTPSCGRNLDTMRSAVIPVCLARRMPALPAGPLDTRRHLWPGTPLWRYKRPGASSAGLRSASAADMQLDPGQPPPSPSRGGVGGVAPRGVPLSRSSALLDTAAGAALRKEVADAGTADSGRERAMLMARAQAGDREADYRLLEDITPFP